MQPFDLRYSITGLAAASQCPPSGKKGDERTVIAGRLEYPHALFHGSPRVPGIIGRIYAREEGDIHAEGFLCPPLRLLDGLA
jgi:hypothetical protein